MLKKHRKMRSLMYWLKATEEETLSSFAELKDAKRVGTGDRQYVYIRGKNEKKVLLVAHADSVFFERQNKVDPVYDSKQKVFYSNNKEVGIQADDRAGCAILWRLRESGHSLLIVNREERGCIGSRFLMEDKEMADEINKHQFAIQFDRHDFTDLVFYDVGSDEFIKWCEENFTGFKHNRMCASTDIKHLCRDMCGVNISCGYVGEHGFDEKLYIEHWQNTLNVTRKVLEKNDLPRFDKPKIIYKPYNWESNNYNTRRYSEHNYQDDYGRMFREEDYQIERSIWYGTETIIKCPKCGSIQVESEYRDNGNKCSVVRCNKEFTLNV